MPRRIGRGTSKTGLRSNLRLSSDSDGEEGTIEDGPHSDHSDDSSSDDEDEPIVVASREQHLDPEAEAEDDVDGFGGRERGVYGCRGGDSAERESECYGCAGYFVLCGRGADVAVDFQFGITGAGEADEKGRGVVDYGGFRAGVLAAKNKIKIGRAHV